MDKLSHIGGAKAALYIDSEGALRQLADIISSGMAIPKFWIKSDQDFPHPDIAMCECLGFEMWLQESKEVKGYRFRFGLESISDVDCDEKADLSAWLSQRLLVDCGIKSIHNSSQ